MHNLGHIPLSLSACKQLPCREGCVGGSQWQECTEVPAECRTVQLSQQLRGSSCMACCRDGSPPIEQLQHAQNRDVALRQD